MAIENNMFSEFAEISNEEWKTLILKSLKLGTEKEKEVFYKDNLIYTPSEGLEISPFYTQHDTKELSYLKGFNKLLAQSKRTSGWMNIENIKVVDEKISNVYATKILNQGVDGVCFDLTEKKNIDFQVLLNEILLTTHPIYFITNEIENLIEFLKEKYKNPEKIMGGIICRNILNTDINKLIIYFKNAAFFKPFIFETEEDLDTISQLSSLFISLIKKIDFLILNNFTYQEIFEKIGFKINVKNDYFIEISKLRALRLLWWKIGKAHLSDLNLIDVFIYCSTTVSENIEEPYKNFISNTSQAMSAVIGGCDALNVSPANFENETDMALSQRIARNVSVILKEESYLDKVIDMGSGSYLIENITHQIVLQVWKKITHKPVL